MPKTKKKEVAAPESGNLTSTLLNQHPMHGLFASVFEKMGGEQFLLEWAQDNPGRFITLLTKMTPNLQPTVGTQSEIRLVIDNKLGRTALDIEDAEVVE